MGHGEGEVGIERRAFEPDLLDPMLDRGVAAGGVEGRDRFPDQPSCPGEVGAVDREADRMRRITCLRPPGRGAATERLHLAAMPVAELGPQHLGEEECILNHSSRRSSGITSMLRRESSASREPEPDVSVTASQRLPQRRSSSEIRTRKSTSSSGAVANSSSRM